MASRGGIGSNFLTRTNGPTNRLLKTIGGVNKDDSHASRDAPARPTPCPTDDKSRGSTSKPNGRNQLPTPAPSRNGVRESAVLNTSNSRAPTSATTGKTPTISEEHTTHRRLVKKSEITTPNDSHTIPKGTVQKSGNNQPTIIQAKQIATATTSKASTLSNERAVREEFAKQNQMLFKEDKGTIKKRALEELRARRQAKTQQAANHSKKPTTSNSMRGPTLEVSNEMARAPLGGVEGRRKGINRKIGAAGENLQDQKDIKNATAGRDDDSASSPRTGQLPWKTAQLSNSPKRSHEEMSGGPENHLTDEHGFVVGSSQDKVKFKKAKTYGGRQQSSQQSLSSSQKQPSPKDLKLAIKNEDSTDFQNPLGKFKLDALDKVKRLVANDKFEDPSKKVAAALAACPAKEEGVGFKRPRQLPLDSLSPSQDNQERDFKKPRTITSSPPTSAFVKPKSAPLSPSLGRKGSKNLPRSPVSKFKMPPRLPLEALSAQGQTNRRSLRSNTAVAEVGLKEVGVDTTKLADYILNSKVAPKDLQKLLGAALEPTESNGFSIKPSLGTESIHSTDSSPLSSPPSSPPLTSSQGSQVDAPRKPHERLAPSTDRCPLCRELVDPEFLKSFASGKNMVMRNQSKFCRAHKKKTAEVEWVTRGYPHVKWDGLQARIHKLHSHLEDLLDGKVESHYRNNLEANVKSGKNRTLASSIMSADFQTLTPGYYGSKGARIMFETIMSKYSTKIHDLAVNDKLISTGGALNYIQVVLVPEVAVRLIQEDMKLDSSATARQVLADSVDIGNLLHEDNQA